VTIKFWIASPRLHLGGKLLREQTPPTDPPPHPP